MFYQLYLPFRAYSIPSTVYTLQLLYIPILTDIDKDYRRLSFLIPGSLYRSNINLQF